LPVGVQSPGHVAATDDQAREEFWPHYQQALRCMKAVGEQPDPTEEGFLRGLGPEGPLYVGSPETVSRKIVATLHTLGARRFDLMYGMGGLSHEARATNIRLYGREVIPRVRNQMARPTTGEQETLAT
jgi:alkanesulfonate monooxygenase SsuD/methylene tetrahydromethanopterin reductase-like flavin-dependent oxidoreductase (luciferase family)